MKKIILAIAVVIFAMTLSGCRTWFDYPTGEWECEELKVRLNFNYEGYDDCTSTVAAIGEIETEEGEVLPIICGLSAIGGFGVRYKSEVERYIFGEELYGGTLFNKGKDKMIFRCRTYKGEPTSDTFKGKTYIEFEFVRAVRVISTLKRSPAGRLRDRNTNRR